MSTVILAVAVSEDRPRGKILARGTQGNFGYLHSFHRLCRKYGISPSYFMSYPALRSERLDWLRKAQALGECELGTLSQSWTTPPFAANENRLTGTPTAQQSRSMVEAKLSTLSNAFEARFGRAPIAHMSDGWDFSSNLLNALVANGYTVDCSFAPGVSSAGSPKDNPLNGPYFPSLQMPASRGSAPVLEVPIATSNGFDSLFVRGEFVPAGIGAALGPLFGNAWGSSANLDILRADCRTIQAHLELAIAKGTPTIVLPLQSYDLGIGTSDLATNEDELSDLLQRLDQLFRVIVDTLQVPSLGIEAFSVQHLNAVIN